MITHVYSYILKGDKQFISSTKDASLWSENAL